MARRRRPHTTFRPRLLALEDRRCPSCVVRQGGDTLTITGDRLDNRVSIVQVGDPGLLVACDDAPAQSVRGVRHIVLSTSAGHDRAVVQLGGPDTSPATIPDLFADLGGNDDSITINYFGPSVTGQPGAGNPPDSDRPPIAIDVFGGGGSDSMVMNATGDLCAAMNVTFHGNDGNGFLAHNITDAAATNNVAFGLNGDGGNDTHRTTVQGTQVIHELRIGHHLGDGSDSSIIAIVHVAALGLFTTESHGGPGDDVMIQDANNLTGKVSLEIFGDGGNDTIFARVGFNPQPDLPGFPVFRDLRVTVDGGAGNDVVAASIDLGGQRNARTTVRVLGSAGNDMPSLILTGVGDPRIVDARVDGGTASTSPSCPAAWAWTASGLLSSSSTSPDRRSGPAGIVRAGAPAEEEYRWRSFTARTSPPCRSSTT
jgi:hypothetical protein